MKFNKATVVQVVIVSMLTMVANAPALAQLSADDFLPPAQAKTDADRAALRDVKQADAVKTQTDAATEAPAVTLMTCHSAKGLEFPFVFIVGLEDGNLPHERAMLEGSLDEERRLFYVALTRGRKHVTLFEALSRVRHGREKMCKTSRFLEEIPEALLVKQIRATREMVGEKVAPPEPKPKKKPKPRGPKKGI